MRNQQSICVLAAILLIALPGCRAFWTTLGIVGAAGVGAAAVYYAKGDLEADFDQNLGDVYDASIEGVKDLDYVVDDTGTKKGTNEADVEATIPVKGSEDKTAKIHLEKDSDTGKTHVSIRIGVFGDEELSRKILRAIEDHLSAPASTN